MLTTKKIKNFCYAAIGILLESKDDITVTKCNGIYWISIKHTRAPNYIIKDMWNRRAAGTKYEKVQLSVF